MERIRYPDSREVVEIKTLIGDLANGVPQGEPMNALKNKLYNAVEAARSGKVQVMEMTFQSAYESYNALTDPHPGASEKMEEIVRKIRTLSE